VEDSQVPILYFLNDKEFWMSPLIPGFGLIFLAAMSGGVFAVPLKMRRRYAWENTWFLGFLFALIIIPFIAVSVFLPVWFTAVTAAGTKTTLIAMAFGFLWGWGAVTFAIGITSVGLSLGYAVIMGVNTVVGSTIPMMRRWNSVPGDAKLVILIGLLVCLVGTAVCGKAGVMRERARRSNKEIGGEPSGGATTAVNVIAVGLFWCVVSGVLSACVNLGFDFANRVSQEALRLGAHPLAATLGPWLTVYWGGFLAILIGTGSVMIRKGTWKIYLVPGTGRDFVLAILLGLFNYLAQIPYGMGAYYLGHLGTTVGWVINIASSLLVANAFGFLTGEWKIAPRYSVRMLYWGLGVLVISMTILGYGNSLAS
jgi:L-rhamnose-H+ transport protein